MTQTVGVVGAGTMGSGIAQAFAGAGYAVRLVDTSQQALDRAHGTITRSLAKLVEKGRCSAKDAQETADRIAGATTLAALSEVDYVVEAVTENLAAKQDVLLQLDAMCRRGVILASNTIIDLHYGVSSGHEQTRPGAWDALH